MVETGELQHNITLSFHSIHAKQGHFGSSTEFIAGKRVVVHKHWGAKKRLWGLLPLKAFSSDETPLPIPQDITTEEQLHRYVREQHPYWLH